jgi:soluble lytic murein transglycosylase-like protein
MSGIAAIASIGAVQARVGQIEQRFGVLRTLPVDTSSTPPASTPPSSTAVAPTTATGASIASAAAAIAADPSASLTELLGTDPTAGHVTAGQTGTGGSSFDQVFQTAVAELQAQWQQAGLMSTGATTVPAIVTTGSLATATPDVAFPGSGTVGVAGPVAASTPYAAMFEAAGARYGIPAKVLAAIGYVESRFRTDAVSSAGAVGMMQFLPSTAASMGVDPHDPASAIDGTARYLRSALDRFGSIEQAIASYNVGPGAIARAGGVPPGSQAERYLTNVLDATGRI